MPQTALLYCALEIILSVILFPYCPPARITRIRSSNSLVNHTQSSKVCSSIGLSMRSGILNDVILGTQLRLRTQESSQLLIRSLKCKQLPVKEGRRKLERAHFKQKMNSPAARRPSTSSKALF